MNTEKRSGSIGSILPPVLSASLISASLTAVLLIRYYSRMQFQLLGDFCEEMIRQRPDSRQTVLEFLKAQQSNTLTDTGENILLSFGYQPSDFWGGSPYILFFIGAGFLTGSLLFFLSYLYWKKKSAARINALTSYLEKINTGGQGLLLDTAEDEFSLLRDEIYKTVTTLYQTRDAALEAKNNYADNLSNIAHQLKTPITSISLSVQMMEKQCASDYSAQIRKQLSRLTYLEEALLLLSRIDAGTLALKQTEADVFTLLTLASDHLQELLIQKGVFIDIPETDAISITADLDWTMEAMMNLMKNCMEHTGAGTAVHCSYEKNPLYVQIRIWDEGAGFAKEDLPHLFERFYRGKTDRAKSTGSGGIGVGLSLSKAIIEMQNGIIRAFNLPCGGACFEIRFYTAVSH